MQSGLERFSQITELHKSLEIQSKSHNLNANWHTLREQKLISMLKMQILP